MRPALSLVMILALGSPALASDAWEDHMVRADSALARGDRDRAEQELELAVRQAYAFPPGDPRLETTVLRLARLYEDDGRLDEAQPQYELLVAACEVRAGADSPELLPALAAAGRVALGAGDIATGEHHLMRYAAIAEVTGEAPASQHWRILSLLSRTLVLQERLDEALVYQQDAFAVIQADPEAGPDDHAEVSRTLAELQEPEPESAGDPD
jgi:hypothetical protein